MVNTPNNPYKLTEQNSRLGSFKTKLLSLTLRVQIFVALGVVALVAVIVVGATTIINLGNPGGIPGVVLRFSPVDAIRAPGDTLSVDLILDTAGQQVSAVQAVFDIDTSRLDLVCVDTTNCPGIAIDPAWGTIADLSRVGSTVRVSVGAATPVSGNGIKVATIQLSVPASALLGAATASFNTTVSAVIADDGLGTNILDEVHSEDWIIETNTAAVPFEIISGPSSQVDCQVPEAVIAWTTSELADSSVAYSETSCPGCPWFVFVAQAGTQVVADTAGVLDHQIVLPGLAVDTQYYYRVMSTSIADGTQISSGENLFSTVCVPPPVEVLEITNLYVDPSARSAAVTWSTNMRADSQVTSLTPVNGQGQSAWSDSTLALSHSLSLMALSPETNYCLDVRSRTLEVATGDVDTGSICFDTKAEDLSLDANIILKVIRDRVCGQWLSCASAVEVEIKEERQSMCFDRQLCNELDPSTGECLSIASVVPGTGSVLEFSIVENQPELSDINLAKNLSGYSKAGANWRGICDDGLTPPVLCSSDTDCGGGFCIIDPQSLFTPGDVAGQLSVAAQEQLGSSHRILNGDFESGIEFPWVSRFDERATTSEVLNVTDSTLISQGSNQVLSIRPVRQPLENVSGVKVPLGRSLRAGPQGQPLQYYVSFDVRSSDEQINKILVQFGFKDYTAWTPPSPENLINVSSGWQTVIAGPLEFTVNDLPGQNEQTYLGILADLGSTGNSWGTFYIDNVTIQPVLNVRPGDVNITKSCRQYPSADAPACRYFDLSSGRELQGWEGYCLETDPRNERRCIQWAPIDLVAGAGMPFASYKQAGYGTASTDRVPLYYCTQAKGNMPYERRATTVRKVSAANYRLLRKHGNFGGWDKASGLQTFDKIKDASGRYLNTAGTEPLYDYEIEQIVIEVTSAQSADWFIGHTISLNRGNDFSDSWCGGKTTANINCPENPTKDYWVPIVSSNTNCGRFADNNETNIWGARVIFDSAGRFESIEAGLCDGSASDGWIETDTKVYLREFCTEVAQVVDTFGTNTAWAQRIHNDEYQVPGLGYEMSRDLIPFGGIVHPAPDHDPTRWDASSQEPGRQPLYVEPANTIQFPSFPHQARASSPYNRTLQASNSVFQCAVAGASCDPGIGCPIINDSCVTLGIPGDPREKVCEYSREDCSGAPEDCPDIIDVCVLKSSSNTASSLCVSGSNLGSSCSDHRDCGTGGGGLPGRCTGVVAPPDIPSESEFITNLSSKPFLSYLSNLFARSQAVWRWSFADQRYALDPGAGWDRTRLLPSAPPHIRNLRIEGGAGSLLDINDDIVFDSDFGKVTLKFNSVVEAEQLPMVRYTVDWGDGKISEESDLRIVSQSDKPHVLTHTYVWDKGSFPAGQTFRPRIQIEDNWGWCSGNVTFDELSGTYVPIIPGGENYSGDGTMCESWDIDFSQVIFGSAQPPVANATLSPTLVGRDTPVTFDATVSFDPDGTIVANEWRDNGTVFGVLPLFSHTFSDLDPSGPHTITLTVTDNDGFTDSASVTVDILPRCDDGIDNDGDGPIDYPADPGCVGASDDDETNVVEATMFVSDTPSQGGFGGVAGANAICQGEADSAPGVVRTGTWRAWVSSSMNNFTGFTPTPLLLRTTEQVAPDVSYLSSGQDLQHAPNKDKNGQVINTQIWTGLSSSGLPQIPNCQDWTSNLATERGRIGDVNFINSGWTDAGSLGVPCSRSDSRFYCIYYGP